MVQCCRYNGSGLCKNCSCVEAGKACLDSLPSKRQRCSNLGNHSPCSPPTTQQTATTTTTITRLPPATMTQQAIQNNIPFPAGQLDGSVQNSQNSPASSSPQLMPTKRGKLPDYNPSSDIPIVYFHLCLGVSRSCQFLQSVGFFLQRSGTLEEKFVQDSTGQCRQVIHQ